MHYTFEEPKSSEKSSSKDKSNDKDKSSAAEGGDGTGGNSSSRYTVDEWIESLERAKEMALSQNLVGSNDNFGDLSSSPASSMINVGGSGGNHHNGRGHHGLGGLGHLGGGNYRGGDTEGGGVGGGYSISEHRSSGRNQLTKSQASLDQDSSSVINTKRNRFSRRQSKNGLGAAF